MSDARELGDSDDKAEEILRKFATATESRDVQQSQSAALGFLRNIAQKLSEEPSPHILALREASDCEAEFDWAGAEDAYRRSLSLIHGNNFEKARIYRMLAAFYGLLDREAESLEADRQAIACAPRGGHRSIMLRIFLAEGAFYLKTKNLPEAQLALSRIFENLEARKLSDEPRGMSELDHVLALVFRARCFIEEEKFDDAEEDLRLAWPIMEPWSSAAMLAGWQGAFVSWWGTMARLQTSRGDDGEAVTAWRECVTKSRLMAQLPQLERPHTLNSLAVTLRNLGRSQKAANDPLMSHSFVESRSIRKSIGLPPLEE